MVAMNFNMDLFYKHNIDKKSLLQNNYRTVTIDKGKQLASKLPFTDTYIIKLTISKGTYKASFRTAGE